MAMWVLDVIRGHPYITYAPRGEGGSVRIGILRTGAYGGEGRGSWQMRTYVSRLMLVLYNIIVEFVVGYNYIALLGKVQWWLYTTRNTHYRLRIYILYKYIIIFIHSSDAREIKLDFGKLDLHGPT